MSPEPKGKNQSYHNNSDSVDSLRARGTDPAYLAARIARDAPAVHEAMKKGGMIAG